MSVAGGFSVVVNMLMLVSPLYMLQVYDRVLTSSSMETLILITVLAIGLLITMVVADAARRKVLALGADQLQKQYGRGLFKASMAAPNADKTLQKDLSNLSTVQAFFSNGLVLPIFDLPFTPFFLLIMFLIHPIIGWLGVVGAIILLIIAVFSEIQTRDNVMQAQSAENSAQNFATGLARQQSAIVSMGMADVAFRNWAQQKAFASGLYLQGSEASGIYGSTTRGIRIILTIGALGLGAWLVLQQQSSPGVIIAGTILLGRALAPIDQSVGMWRQIIRVRQAWAELQERHQSDEAQEHSTTPMPRPDAKVQFENLEVACPGSEKPLLPKFNLSLQAGSMIALVGGIGSGKTSLLQTTAGAWPPFSGAVHLGGRDLHRWDMVDRGRYVGYLPQDSELLFGTVAQNIGRFSNAPTEAVIETARFVGCHEMIMSLPDGYDTVVGPGGIHLSAGQKQIIGITRALFGQPVMLLLDEPTANLDAATVQQLKNVLTQVKASGAIVIMATHDLRLVEISDNVVMLTPENIKMLSSADYFAGLRKAHPAFIKQGSAQSGDGQ
ncbi:MAG: ATP-binding cassette domain-containing protein [Gammaproteobacteria bacterium]|nr:ATP-binding cassette domain-containing protein [Gammaproteobacteria bacterium]